MSDDVNDQDIGALAAEFVLGTLDSDERARANELLESDPHFRGMVRVWERRLGELHLMVEPVEPPAPIWDRIKTKLDSVEQDAAVSQPEVPEAPEMPEMPEVPPAASTIATLEALEAELREEGLAPPEAPAIEPPAPAPEPSLAATRDLDWEPAPARQNREATPDSHSAAGRWRVLATLMTLVAIALAGLIAAWRYIPERLPPQLGAVQVLNLRIPEPAPAPVRPPAPPGSQFDE
jgi:anti-sigma-K factor RskA